MRFEVDFFIVICNCSTKYKKISIKILFMMTFEKNKQKLSVLNRIADKVRNHVFLNHSGPLFLTIVAMLVSIFLPILYINS